MVLPTTRRTDTPAYEHVLCHRRNGHTAVVQVKSGDEPVALELLPSDKVARSYAYAASGRYEGSEPANLEVISDDQLLEFMRAEAPARAAARVRNWTIAVTA
jgi:hypothetical protein